MSIHKSEGLVPINDRCESTVPGLYAAGDALGSYMAGAIYTQIGSSLAGSAVQGAIAAEAAADYSKGIQMPTFSTKRIDEIHNEILTPLKRESGYGPAWGTQVLRRNEAPGINCANRKPLQPLPAGLSGYGLGQLAGMDQYLQGR